MAAVAGVFLAKAKRAQPGLCMVDHMLARCKWAARLGDDDIAEARGVEHALRGADMRLQAHHVYGTANVRSRRKLMQAKHRCSCCQLAASTPSEHRCTCVRVKLQRGCATEHNCVLKDVLKLLAAMQCATFGKARGRWNTCAHSRLKSSPRWCMHTSARTQRWQQSSLSSMWLGCASMKPSLLVATCRTPCTACTRALKITFTERQAAGLQPVRFGAHCRRCVVFHQPWSLACMHACVVVNHVKTCAVRHIRMWHLPIIDLLSCTACAWALCSNDVSQ